MQVLGRYYTENCPNGFELDCLPESMRHSTQLKCSLPPGFFARHRAFWRLSVKSVHCPWCFLISLDEKTEVPYHLLPTHSFSFPSAWLRESNSLPFRLLLLVRHMDPLISPLPSQLLLLLSLALVEVGIGIG